MTVSSWSSLSPATYRSHNVDPEPTRKATSKASTQKLRQMQQMMQYLWDQIEMSQQRGMPGPEASMPWNMPSPNSQYFLNQNFYGPSYWNGPNMGQGSFNSGYPDIGGLSQGLGSAWNMIGNVMNQMGGMPNMGGGMPNMGPMSGPNAFGGWGGTGAMNNNPFSDPQFASSYYQAQQQGASPSDLQGMVSSWYMNQLQKTMDNFTEQMQLASKLESDMHQLKMSIIQNI